MPGFGYEIVDARTVSIIFEDPSKRVAHFYTLHLHAPWFDGLATETLDALASSLAGTVKTATEMQEYARLASKQKESFRVRDAHHSKASMHVACLERLSRSVEDGLLPRRLKVVDVMRCEVSARKLLRRRGVKQ